MDYIPQYIDNKINHPTDFTVPFEPLKDILKDTYGVLVYQEQVMIMSTEMCGYTGVMSDYLRKAIGKKKQELIDEHKQYFIYGNLETEKKEVKRVCGGVANGFDEKKLIDYYDNVIVDFGRYSFEH